MKIVKREEFIDLMKWYFNVDGQIEGLRNLFTEKICNPETDIFYAFDRFSRLDDEICELVNKKEKLGSILARFKKKDMEFIFDLTQNKTKQELAEKYGVTQGTISDRIGNITRKFSIFYDRGGINET